MAEQTAAVVLAAGVTKKKFAAPPVKSACLACRAARTRCDGAQPCTTCQGRDRECIYMPSRRGGPRRRKKPRPHNGGLNEGAEEEGEARQIPDDVYAMLSQEPLNAHRDPLSIQDYIDPGAGLKHLEDWVPDSDFIFDSLFINPPSDPIGTTTTTTTTTTIDPVSFAASATQSRATPTVIPVVRTYASDAAVLDAYYVFIHPYLPILPPPTAHPVDRPLARPQTTADVLFAQPYEPSSPLTLALSAVLALIPCPDEDGAHHASREAQLFRRKFAQYCAQAAFETLEADAELPASAVAPERALSADAEAEADAGRCCGGRRTALHPRMPAQLEGIAALCVLSVYEYAQRGNLKKMQSRAGLALMEAMDMSLHTCKVEDEFTEARRRVWWMSYICVAQASIVGNTKPAFLVFSPSYTAEFPTFMADPDAFSVYIQAQRAILAATQFVIELNETVKANADMSPIYERMKELETFLEPLLTHSESWLLTATTTSPVEPSEEVVARSLRCMASIKLNSARIKIHRYCAFFDIPIFSRKHCDLTSLNQSSSADDTHSEPRQWPTCSCSIFANPFAAPTPAPTSTGLSPSASDGGSVVYGTTPHHHRDVGAAMMTPPPQPLSTNFPFSSHQSARICLKSALAIAQAFEDLPFPNPMGSRPASTTSSDSRAVLFLSPTSTIVCPRTMPSFACCAMQCAYALLMVHQKTKTLYVTPGGAGAANGAPGPVAVGSLMVRLQQGLTSIYETLANYATAFEALGGMRDQIRSAVEESSSFAV